MKHNLKWHDHVKNSSKPLVALSNQLEQLRLVKKFQDNEDNAALPNVKNKLISKILCGLEEEMLLLKEILKECESSNKELKNKLVIVEGNCEVVETEALLRGTATTPALCLMIEWAQDAWRLYHAFFVQIRGALGCLDYDNEETVTNLQNAFREDAEMKIGIQRILAYTKFFVEDS